MEISARLNPISYEKPLSKRTIRVDIAEEYYFFHFILFLKYNLLIICQNFFDFFYILRSFI